MIEEKIKEILDMKEEPNVSVFVDFKPATLKEYQTRAIKNLLTKSNDEIKREALESFWQWCMKNAYYSANDVKNILCDRKTFEEYLTQQSLDKGDKE